MDLFGKKKKQEEEDALIDKLTKNTEKTEGAEYSKKGGTDAEIEKIGAQMAALREVLQAQQERFERQSEEIGELRSALAEREKHMRDIEAKAMKAADLVEDVQPENLMSDQKKIEAKIEAIRAKIESGEALTNNMIEELKKIKSSVSIFRGTEEIVKLNKEVTGEIMSIKKIEAGVQKHADRVESLFSAFEVNFDMFEKMKETVRLLAETTDALKKDSERNSAALKDIPKKDEFYQMKSSIQKTLEDIRNEKSVYSERNRLIENAIGETVRTLRNLEAMHKNTKQAVSKNAEQIGQMLDVTEKMAAIIARNSREAN